MRFDYAVIGAGIVGLAVARQLRGSHPDASVVVLDKETGLARHASGRNSGVLHAGFYYSPDSLKARLTRHGNRMLREFCAQQAVPVEPTGKVVVARTEAELPRLDALAERAARNGVPVELVGEARLHELEPLARTVTRALWSPTTAVADPVAVVAALASDTRRRGVDLRLGRAVTGAGPGWIATPDGTLAVGHVVNCAGLYADRVADWFGMCDDYRVLPFKGGYRYLNWPPGRLRRLVYPVPDPDFPFLGIHLTVTAAGRVKIGPTALPVPTREHYDWRHGIANLSEVAPTAAGLVRFLGHSPRQSWQLLRAQARAVRPSQLARAAAQLVPTVSAGDLAGPAPPGIRAQLVDRRTGALEMDFVVRGDEHATHVLNAVSPAWTSALAVAEHVVARMP